MLSQWQVALAWLGRGRESGRLKEATDQLARMLGKIGQRQQPEGLPTSGVSGVSGGGDKLIKGNPDIFLKLKTAYKNGMPAF